MLRDTNNSARPTKPRPRFGQRLDADVYDPQGVLLLKAGEVVQQLHWVPRLEGKDVNAKQPLCESSSPPTSPEQRVLMACKTNAARLTEQVKIATFAKQDAANAVASVFDRMSRQEEIGAGMLKPAVGAMLASLAADPRALLSLALLKDADNYTHMHSVNVSVLAMCLGMNLGMAPEIENIGIGGLVHDIGKIETPLHILRKPGSLSNAEAHIMRQHPVAGARILTDQGSFSRVSVLCARDHHESVNGRGYPSGKKSGEICPQAQIIAMADVYDALTTNRPYRPALLPQQALRLMTSSLCGAFAPDLLATFVGMVGYHPVGSAVSLANGYGGIVLQNDPNEPSRPALVQALTAPDGSVLCEPVFLDLRANPDMLDDALADDAVIDRATPLVMRELRGFDAFA